MSRDELVQEWNVSISRFKSGSIFLRRKLPSLVTSPYSYFPIQIRKLKHPTQIDVLPAYIMTCRGRIVRCNTCPVFGSITLWTPSTFCWITAAADIVKEGSGRCRHGEKSGSLAETNAELAFYTNLYRYRISCRFFLNNE